jgi:hypothetical protein
MPEQECRAGAGVLQGTSAPAFRYCQWPLPTSNKERSSPMNPGVIKLILLAVEAVCVLVVTAVTVSDSVKKNKDNKK